MAVVAAAGIAVAIGAEARPEPYRAMRTIGDRLEREVPDSGTTRVDGTSFDALAFKAGAVYVLRRAGRDVVATGAGSVLGSDYEPSKGFDRLLRIDADKPSVLPAADGGRRIARLDFHDQERVVIVTLLSAP